MMRDGHLSGHHRRTLDEIFQHPEPANLHWMDAVGLVGAIGEVEEKHDGKFLFRVGDVQDTFHKPHHKELTLPEIRQLKSFLSSAGVEPGSVEPSAETDSELSPSDVVVVVAHHETRILAVEGEGEATTLRPYDPYHYLHHLDHKRESDYRGQRSPEDLAYYARIADALKDARRILVVSHGTGESDAGAILAERLKAKHGDVYARVVRMSHVDTSGLSDAQLAAMARDAFVSEA